MKQYKMFYFNFSGRVSPFAHILTSLKTGEDLKYFDLTKLEDTRYGICCLLFYTYSATK